MAQLVGKGFTIHLSASLRAGTKALQELCLQGRILTTNWYYLKVEPIDNNGSYSDVRRTLTFTLENEQRVEIKVITWKRELGDMANGDSGRKWGAVHVYIENGQRMQAFENHIYIDGSYPWSRQPECDKPLPGTTWRVPTNEEIVAYKAAILYGDEDGFLKVYYSDLIEWKELNDHLGKNTQWVRTTLLKFA